MLARAMIDSFFMKKKLGWFMEMVQADIIVGEISCQHDFSLTTFFE